ncbi:protein-tyrosine phosphatase [Natronospira proteinivora]|uniref:protein-tyrosine-phosphatase n=1 Tax=Natronospira proteinivora TaxID=1807133 RepID=A0ABT1G5Y4_9GAMM|nr:low molecular weight protein-tyrosine-phosphatase [Natronospira proteinivora]MCP1726710.1 protein-tyrosine phosphatase [Natronospira proteinivora]
MSKRILFVCMGNICRSPTAEAVFRHRLTAHGHALSLVIDSAGTHGYHVGHPPDGRAVEAAARRGVSLEGITARRVEEGDFHRFDLILCADESNLRMLEEMQPPGSPARLQLLLEFADSSEREVPDPYYGGDKGFEKVLDLIESACDGLIHRLASSSR